MPAEQNLRRASYGRNSPTVLERGARTRQRIIHETLQLFDEKGYYGTLSDDIAERSGIARATLYQYFDGKEAIFRELMEDCSAALHRLVRRLGPLGPTEQGFENLHWWLGEWSWIYDRYATIFTQWTQVSRSGPLSSSVRDFLTGYSAMIAPRLNGVTGIDPYDSAFMLTVMANRVFYGRAAGDLSPLSEQEVVDTLATAVQLMNFPDTPTEALRRVVLDSPRELPLGPVGTAARSAGSVRSPGSVRSAGSASRPTSVNRFSGAGQRARITIDRLLDSSCESFCDLGYHLASVDDVVTRAGVARGTFYKYFADKPDLLGAVLERSYRDLTALLADAAVPEPENADLHDQLTAFLHSFTPWYRKYAGALRVGLDRMNSDDVIHTTTRLITLQITETFERPLKQTPRDYPFSPRVAATIMTAIVGRGLEGAPLWTPQPSHHHPTPTPHHTNPTTFLATLIERALFNQRPPLPP